MEKLDITQIKLGSNKTVISWHRYNTDNNENNSEGTWEKEGTLTKEEVIEYAKTMVEQGIEVGINL